MTTRAMTTNLEPTTTTIADRRPRRAPPRAPRPRARFHFPFSIFHFPSLRTRRGAAMLLVLSVVAVAAVLGYAMLSVASLQRQVERNLSRGPEADALAESGVNLAIYYLLHPESAPGYPGWADLNWHWPGTGGPIGFDAPPGTLDGTVHVTVARDPVDRYTYTITSAGLAGAGPVTRTLISRVQVNADYEILHAATFAGNVALGMYTQLGAPGEPTSAYARGSMIIKTGGKLYGNGYKGLFSPSSPAQPIGGTFKPLPPVPAVVPAALSDLRDYRTYTLPGDPTVYHAQIHTPSASLLGELLEPVLGILALGSGGETMTFGPSADNPAGVHYVNGDVQLGPGATVNGTLIVTGNLLVAPGAGSATITSQRPTLPALVVAGRIDAAGATTAGGALHITGAAWVGGKIDGAAGTNLTVNLTGALLSGGALFPSSLYARTTIRHRPDLAQLRDFTHTGRTPKSVRVLDWQK